MNGARFKEREGGCSRETLCAQTTPNPNGDNGFPGPAESILSAESGSNPRSHHVVTLAFLSEHLPASLISERLARSLCDETESPVVLVRFERLEGEGTTRNGTQPACLNG